MSRRKPLIPDDDRYQWFPCDAEKLLGALAGLPPEQGYTYIVTLLRMYAVGGPCPDTPEQLARRIGWPLRKVNAALDALKVPPAGGKKPAKLRDTEGGLVNDFAADVLAIQDGKRKKAIQDGKEGAAARWGKTEENQATGVRVPMATPSRLVADLERDSDGKKKKAKVKKDSRPPAASRGCPLPADWTPSTHLIDYGVGLGLSAKVVVDELESLRLWAVGEAHNRSKWKDGDGGWLAWFQGKLKDVAKYGPSRRGGSGHAGTPRGRVTAGDVMKTLGGRTDERTSIAPGTARQPVGSGGDHADRHALPSQHDPRRTIDLRPGAADRPHQGDPEPSGVGRAHEAEADQRGGGGDGVGGDGDRRPIHRQARRR